MLVFFLLVFFICFCPFLLFLGWAVNACIFPCLSDIAVLCLVCGGSRLSIGHRCFAFGLWWLPLVLSDIAVLCLVCGGSRLFLSELARVSAFCTRIFALFCSLFCVIILLCFCFLCGCFIGFGYLVVALVGVIFDCYLGEFRCDERPGAARPGPEAGATCSVLFVFTKVPFNVI